jgi:tripartite-type tricarboxylate transporter receptor subunit TctC
MIRAFLKMAGIVLLSNGIGSAAMAQSYPTQNVRLIVPFAGGSPSDVIARLLAESLKASLNNTVYVENKPGAAGRIALNDLLSRPRDGHTLYLCSHITANNTVVLKKPGYKLEDIASVALVAKSFYAFTVSNAVPANSLQEFLQYARSRPGSLNYGRVGPGGITDLVVRQFEHVGGFKSTGVTFKGTHEAVLEMTAARMDFVVGPYNLTMPLHEAKKVKVLAMTSPERLSVAPDIPTFVEQKIPIVKFGWWGICAGAGVPKEVVEQLNQHIAAAVKSSAYATLMEKNGMTAASSTSQELDAVLAADAASTATLMQQLGLPQLD